MEEWRDIPGLVGRYQASSKGRIKRLPLSVSNHTGIKTLKERIINGSKTSKGYIQIEIAGIGRSNGRILKQAHVLIAMAFVANPNNLPQVNHINGVKSDNRPENLEWCDNSGNQKHAWRIGLQKVSGKAGRPKRAIILTHAKDGDELCFGSIAEACRFLGGKKHHKDNLLKVLSNNYPHYKTINGYKARYAV